MTAMAAQRETPPKPSSSRKVRLLLVEDEPDMMDIMTAHLSDFPVDLDLAGSFADAKTCLESQPPDILITDVRLGDGNGTDLLEKHLAANPNAQGILVTAFGSISDAVDAIREGACDYIQKPFKGQDLVRAVSRAIRQAGLSLENQQLRASLEERYRFDQMVGSEENFLDALRLAGSVADSSLSVLIQGDSGTGKELLARGIHFNSGRKQEPFLAINCAAIPDTLLESELFGYKKGAFTGADRDRDGLLAKADGGTLFLDEITETSHAFQKKLLRFLQEQEFMPVGGREVRSCSVRILAATNQDISRRVSEGEFREDLFYRIAGLLITLPSLKQRPADICLLAQSFLDKLAKENPEKNYRFSPQARQALEAHDWPGNVRELFHAVERAIILAQEELIQAQDLFPWPNSPELIDTNPVPEVSTDLNLEAIEERYMTQALKKSNGNVSKAARLLGVSRPQLRYRLEKKGWGGDRIDQIIKS